LAEITYGCMHAHVCVCDGSGGVGVATYFSFLIHCLGRGNKVVKLRFPW